MRIRLIAPSIALSFLLAAFAAFVTPVCALAIVDNPAENVLDVVGNGEVMNVNYGKVKINEGEVRHNATDAVIADNFGIVRKNDGVIQRNFSTNVNIEDGTGTIRDNYFVYEDQSKTIWGTCNNFYRVASGSLIPALDWSLNPDELSASSDLYVGASSNAEGLRGATFRAAEGYEITLNSDAGDGFSVSDNGNGTFTVSVAPDYRKTEINLGSVLKVQKLAQVSVAVSPVGGGVVVRSDSGDEFASGWFAHGTRITLQAVANEGYRFVGWDVPSDDHRVQVDQDGILAVYAQQDEHMYPEPVSCAALFEKLASDEGDSGAPGSGSAGGSGAQSSSQSTLAQAGDDSHVGLLACAAAVSLAVLVMRRRPCFCSR